MARVTGPAAIQEKSKNKAYAISKNAEYLAYVKI